MADTLTQNGLSIGALNTPQTGAPIPSVTASGTNPSDQIQRAQSQLQSVSILQYPLDLPKYYTGFQIYEYSRSDLMTVATTNLLNSLCMPFPDQMMDVNQVAYDKKDFSSFIGNIANAAWPLVGQITNNVQNGDKALTGIGKDQLKPLLTNGAVGAGQSAFDAVFGEAGKTLEGAAGYSPNYFLTVVLNGPQYKQYSFSWTCAPRSPQESAALRQIIRVFQDAQAPGLALGGTLFSFPRVFQNYFGPDRAMLYQFKPSVLMSFAVNYTPAGMPSMKQSVDPVLQGYHAPTAVRIQANFMELEFWLRGDFGDVSVVASGVQSFSNEIHPIDVATTGNSPAAPTGSVQPQ